ncbi:MAG: ABC transporter permease [Gemmatimonadetes bacterium]|uniref:ABC transporter permease n=1 Tax=Candidatus Kutchimonas denitrificans TaxID=3056748 RepID=A0AAE5CAQ5_9BACT|nr:ABC transporter permease [Gemmatimonadota bacterium]NIR73575.1 ABC transporter permease [Candidatus Kutchimonas denitrificans]NIR99534.1 ABC transporter permease [Gemmatimonadota bacterium]NIT65154.1 ABC transporter permease [Gemmatimonadota bacterium]NIV23687.1 FtsX-like permease family protein [Gemmatimonadota bacterium]
MLGTLTQDVRFAIRQLINRPGFTAGAVLTLALGIGANSAIFSVVNGVLLRPLPYEASDRLMALWHRDIEDGDLGSTSLENFRDWKEQAAAFGDMAAFGRATGTLMTDEVAQRLSGARVTTNTFRLLGVSPRLGRDFVEDDAVEGAGRVVILSHGLFARTFGGDPNLIGRTVRLSGVEHEVIGVMPRGFHTPHYREAEFWRPLGEAAGCGRGCWFARVVGRLAPGATRDEVRAQLDVVGERLAAEYPDDNKNVRIAAVPIREELVGDVRPALLVMLVGVGLVLLIACVNVANLLLARAISRERELALRAAIGASRARIVRQLLTESVTLAAIGGAVGVYVAFLVVDALIALSPPGLPRLDAVGLDGPVIAAMAALAMLTGIVFGLVPALHAGRTDAGGALTRDRSATWRHGRGRLRDALVVAEISLALTLLVGAGLLLKSFITLLRVDPGFDADGLLTAETQFIGERYAQGPPRIAFYDELFARLESRSDVTSAAGVWLLPITEGDVVSGIEVEGRPDVLPSDQPAASMRAVTDGYFEAMGIPLISGRRILASDDANGRRVIVISESMAREIWPDQDPIGRRIRFGLRFEDPEPWREVVGVVGDVKLQGLDDRDRAIAYMPYRQFAVGSLSVVLRTTGDPARLAAPFRAAVRSVDPQVVVYDIASMDRIVSASLAERRFFMLLLSAFAALAVTLASVGIYAVTNYSVRSRTKELGIRMAIGARATDVQRAVLVRAAVVAALGVGLGGGAALGLTRLMQGLLFRTSPLDPMVFVGVALLLAVVTLFAAWLPARRAALVDPLRALRQE